MKSATFGSACGTEFVSRSTSTVQAAKGRFRFSMPPPCTTRTCKALTWPMSCRLSRRTSRFDRSEPKRDVRSEEHTSELQSRQYLVCRLLLEKKKNQPSPY